MMWFIPKNKKAILSLTAGLCLSLGFMAGCKEEAPPATKSAVVKKRIEQTPQTAKVTEAEKTTPAAETAGAKATATDTTAAPTAEAAGSKATEATAASEPAAPKAEKPETSATETTPAKAAAQQEKAAAPSETAPSEAPAAKDTRQEESAGGSKAEETEAVSLKSSLLDDTYPKYDPTGKVDPFAALFSKESEAELSDDGEPKRPLTPLERVDISQLKLSAIILAESGDRAMVEDATGKPYILTTGTYVGVNSGTVTKILKDRIVIEETTRDFLGRESTNTRELKLQKPLGEE